MKTYKFINTPENRQKLNARRFYANHGLEGFWYAYKIIGGYRIEVRSEGTFAFWKADFNGLDYDNYDKDAAQKYVDDMVADGMLEANQTYTLEEAMDELGLDAMGTEANHLKNFFGDYDGAAPEYVLDDFDDPKIDK